MFVILKQLSIPSDNMVIKIGVNEGGAHKKRIAIIIYTVTTSVLRLRMLISLPLKGVYSIPFLHSMKTDALHFHPEQREGAHKGEVLNLHVIVTLIVNNQ